MKKKIKLIAVIGCLLLMLGAAVGCAELTPIEQYRQKGYVIDVTYDANGGKFLDRSSVSIVDMYKPTSYTPDSDGTVHIKLTEPTDAVRWADVGQNPAITLANTRHFLAGWYQTREIKMVGDDVVDEDGRILKQLADGKYIVASTEHDETPTLSSPAYLYADRWDFENDTLDYKEGDGIKSITLYAGWVKYYEFHYYYQVEGDTEWKKHSEVTRFDYLAASNPDSALADHDTMWVPTVADGMMQHERPYAKRDKYTFPSVEGATFLAAYKDAECTQPITDEWTHNGSLDLATAQPINPEQNVYVKYMKGEKYWITEASQIENIANPAGIYEIQSDLDFKDAKWPAILTSQKFTGKMFSTPGSTFTLSNVNARFANDAAQNGGLFGSIAGGAEIKDLKFVDLTVDIALTGTRLTNTNFGAFAGLIEEGAVISNVVLEGVTLRLGEIKVGNNYSFHLIANGESGALDGLTVSNKALQIYGTKRGREPDIYYVYTIVDPANSVTVAEDGGISLTFESSNTTRNEAQFDIAVA